MMAEGGATGGREGDRGRGERGHEEEGNARGIFDEMDGREEGVRGYMELLSLCARGRCPSMARRPRKCAFTPLGALSLGVLDIARVTLLLAQLGDVARPPPKWRLSRGRHRHGKEAFEYAVTAF